MTTKTGIGIKYIGWVDTVEQLPKTANDGDLVLVPDHRTVKEVDGDLKIVPANADDPISMNSYIYNGETGEWFMGGPIHGPLGVSPDPYEETYAVLSKRMADQKLSA